MNKYNNNNQEATNLAKAGVTGITGNLFTLWQQLVTEPSAVFAIGFINTIVLTAIDYGARALSPIERQKLDHMGLLMLREVESHLQKNHTPRTDGFLNADTGVRSSAQELCEGLLEISRSEHQEDKLRYIGYLYVSILFTDMVSVGEATRLFRILKSLTYREMCILAALSNSSEYEGLRTNSHSQQEGCDELSSVVQECFELEGLGLLSQVNHDQVPFYGVPSWVYIVPANLRVTEYGKRLMKLSRLSEIPERDTFVILEAMR
jgi:hypothetical protein